MDTSGAPVPVSRSLTALRRAARGCEACDLHVAATQTVFGEGAREADVVFVGEQPGDAEDRRGHPFVGPAGVLLDRAVIEAGISRSAVYLTNAVKHFKFRRAESGKRRIHEKPDAVELGACRPWLRAELEAIRPAVVVVLGATAASTLLGPAFRVTQHRGKPLPWPDVATRSDMFGQGSEDADTFADTLVVATVHPSSVLRSPERKAAFRALVDDLRVVAQLAT